ncbi:tRNA (adenosine(37)-N6)-threonylcarbamoyltransferase complex ATPase subunit type 1 TsaE [Candidatus Nomurabacteria bacterium]|nr:tRNA (adenosine(37)-N6)-threonylcarbamoyltransferase complex ATPase subunit type 1 TsaE [Candidatus Nomurabacteria bacterium]
MKKISKNTKETGEIAKIFLEKILKTSAKQKGALVVALSGDLGAGKTAFTQAVGKHLGLKDKIKSPTFVIFKKYKIKSKKYKFLYHFDAYRLKNEKELLHLGWEEIIGNKEHIVFIEWPENVSGVIPSNARYIYISHKEKGHRSLELK